MQRALVRGFSSGVERHAFSDLYNSITSWGRRKAPRELHDPTQDTKTEETASEDSAPRKLRVLGAPRNRRNDWATVRRFAEFNAFPTNTHRASLTVDQINKAVEQFYQQEAVGNLETRLEVIKNISRELGVAFPDPVFGRVGTKSELTAYLQSVTNKFNEKSPDAVYLESEDFQGTNIIVRDHSLDAKAERARYRALLAQARASERKQAEAVLARQQA